MKKIFFVGKINRFFSDVYGYLKNHFAIQVCADNPDMVKTILKLEKPDFILISMLEMDRACMKLFQDIENKYSNIPVLCLGTEDDFEMLHKLLKMESLHALILPASTVKIHETICEMLLKQNSEDNTNTGVEAKKCVMLVDDNAFQIKVLREMLKEKYDVQLATSGIEAVDAVKKRIPNIIFLDYDMPVYDGKVTLQMIREIEGAKNVPVFFLTGVKDEAHKAAVMELNPTGYLIKPATAEMIHSCLDEFLK